jgi:hypothetical protein
MWWYVRKWRLREELCDLVMGIGRKEGGQECREYCGDEAWGLRGQLVSRAGL